MREYRRKIAATLRDFQQAIGRLERLDADNQRQKGISRQQLYFLTESVFFVAYRSYEGFIRDLFLLYCMNKQPPSGKRIASYLKPRSFYHAEKLTRSALRFVEWGEPEVVIKLAEIFLKDGFPIKIPLSSNIEQLRNYRWIRNHIAHGSIESLGKYKKVLRRHYSTMPLKIPSPGEFLLLQERSSPRHKLLSFFQFLQRLANDLT